MWPKEWLRGSLVCDYQLGESDWRYVKKAMSWQDDVRPVADKGFNYYNFFPTTLSVGFDRWQVWTLGPTQGVPCFGFPDISDKVISICLVQMCSTTLCQGLNYFLFLHRQLKHNEINFENFSQFISLQSMCSVDAGLIKLIWLLSATVFAVIYTFEKMGEGIAQR